MRVPPARARAEPTSSAAAASLSGKIGPAPSPVPRVGSAPDTTLLLPGGAPRSGSPGPAAGVPAAGAPPGAEPEDPSKYAFYNIKRYRTYFNVDTTVRGAGRGGAAGAGVALEASRPALSRRGGRPWA